MFAFKGGYHGRTLGRLGDHLELPLSAALRALRRPRPVRPYPYCFRCPYGIKREILRPVSASSSSSGCSTPNITVSGITKTGKSPSIGAFYIEADPGNRRLRHPSARSISRAEADPRRARKILLVDDEIQMGFYRTGKFWAIEHFGVDARHHRLRQGADQRPQSDLRHLGARGADHPGSLPPGLDPFDLLVQPAGHRRGARDAEDDGGGRLRNA